MILCAAAAAFAAGCSDDPPAGTADGGATADAGSGPWACLGRVAPVTPGGTMVTITLSAVNFSSGMPLPGLTVKACGRADTTCATPHSMGTTDAMGRATLTAPVGSGGFEGYVELTGGTGDNAVVPTRMFPNPPLAAGTQPVTSRVIARETFNLLGLALMAQLNDTSGMITSATSDCDRSPAEGVAFSAMPMPAGARQFYTVNNLPNVTATQTGPAGSGGFVNVPPGDYALTATRVSPMARVGSRSISVRGGYISSINVVPSP